MLQHFQKNFDLPGRERHGRSYGRELNIRMIAQPIKMVTNLVLSFKNLLGIHGLHYYDPSIITGSTSLLLHKLSVNMVIVFEYFEY